MQKKNFITLVIAITLSSLLIAQETVITGSVQNATDKAIIPGASITIKGSTGGTVSDENGKFKLAVNKLPITLVISSVGYDSRELILKNKGSIVVEMDPFYIPGAELVILPSFKRTKIINSHVSIEKISQKDIRNSVNGPYSLLEGLKQTNVVTSSMGFVSTSTRGFNGSGSARVNQFVDGMDNQAPGLNFFVGSFLALSELDVESIELLPGASSALYGPGGMNGTILINSKDPFTYRGFSFLAKQGIMHVDERQRSKSPYYNWSMRWAQVIGNKFAFKINAQYMQAKDWLATDYSNYQRTGANGKAIPGTRETDPNYDGVNVYGDETSVDLRAFLPSPGPDPIYVSRTGYLEKDMVDPNTMNLKLSGALHYKIKDNLEAILVGNWGSGNTVYTGTNRYALKGVKMGQYKMELKNKNWFLRGYTTQENAGEAYSATVTAQFINEGWKRSFNPANIPGSWYPQYTGAYLQALGVGMSASAAHTIARAFADQGRPTAGSTEFKNLFDQVRKVPIPNGGLFIDKTDLWMAEGQYNFSDHIKFAELIVGGNVKKYILNSQGTIFIDKDGPIKINEMGAYAQLTKNLFDEKLVLSASGRFDKNQNFKSNFTPRVTALIRLAKNNNLRLSYQTAYRFPTTQQQYIRLNVGGGVTLLGGLPWIVDEMKKNPQPVYRMDGSAYNYKPLKPESSNSFEIGYKALVDNKLLIDLYSYFGRYQDFLGRSTLVQPLGPNTRNIFSIVENSDPKITTYGFGGGIDYQLRDNYSLTVNAYTDRLSNVPQNFVTSFNTPRYRFNAGFANSGLGKEKRIGFNAVYRWQDAFFMEGDFANGNVESFGTVDAQVTYKLPAAKSMIRIGGTNILNKYYKNAFGNPSIGGLYYVSFGFNIF
jgi:outer membrane receptor protein involved in Fe transport